MGLFDFFFKKRDEPVDSYKDDFLGEMVWSKDSEAWAGERGGIRYLIAYEGQATPKNELLAYARMMLTYPRQVLNAVERAKSEAVAEFPSFADEIDGLRLGEMHFYPRRTGFGVFADLQPQNGDRSWFIEFGEDGCEGIAFDS